MLTTRTGLPPLRILPTGEARVTVTVIVMRRGGQAGAGVRGPGREGVEVTGGVCSLTSALHVLICFLLNRRREPAAQNPGNNLHVSGLSTKVDTRDLESAFAKIGRVSNSYIVTMTILNFLACRYKRRQSCTTHTLGSLADLVS